MRDRKPLDEWYSDFFMMKEIGISLRDLGYEEMDYEMWVFFCGLIDEINRQKDLKYRELTRKMKK